MRLLVALDLFAGEVNVRNDLRAGAPPTIVLTLSDSPRERISATTFPMPCIVVVRSADMPTTPAPSRSATSTKRSGETS